MKIGMKPTKRRAVIATSVVLAAAALGIALASGSASGGWKKCNDYEKIEHDYYKYSMGKFFGKYHKCMAPAPLPVAYPQYYPYPAPYPVPAPVPYPAPYPAPAPIPVPYVVPASSTQENNSNVSVNGQVNNVVEFYGPNGGSCGGCGGCGVCPCCLASKWMDLNIAQNGTINVTVGVDQNNQGWQP